MRLIAIIGAGASGLAAARAVLREGMTPLVLETSPRPGGLWDHATAWPGMTVNISRHSGVFREFPCDKSLPDYPTTQQIYDYLLSYARHFGLLDYVQFSATLETMSRQGRQWNLEISLQGKKSTRLVDAVIIACGRNHQPHIPAFDDLHKIQGKFQHSASYRGAAGYAGKHVLVVGGSYSGTAIAEELASHTTVTHLFSKPRWIIQRNRTHPETGISLPREIINTYAQTLIVKSKEEQFALLAQRCAEQMKIPELRITSDMDAGVAIGEEYIPLVQQKKIFPQQGVIHYFSADSVTLQSGIEIKFDHVIFATGFSFELNFLPAELRSRNLYEDVFIPGCPDLAFVGAWLGSRGPAFPVAELQAEWVCGVFSKRLSLPTSVELHAAATPPKERSGSEYSTAIAKRIGVFPELSDFPQQVQELLLQTPDLSIRYLLAGPFKNTELGITLLEEFKKYRDNRLQKSSYSGLFAEAGLETEKPVTYTSPKFTS
jgi:dimethylaniline monooxygenase (N-oxide forming)